MASSNFKILVALIVLMGTMLCQAVQADDVSGQVRISDLTLVNQTRLSRTVFEYTYKIKASNTGRALTGVVARLTSNSTRTQIIDGIVSIGSLSVGAVSKPTDTINLRLDRSTAFDPAALQWSVSGTPTIDGVVLQGAPDTLALDALSFRIGETPAPDNFDSGLIATRLMAVINIDATVAEVNASLALVRGRITAMSPGSGVIDIGIPAVADETEADAIANQLENTGAFFAVDPAYWVEPTTNYSVSSLPGSIKAPLNTSEGESYFQEIRAPAAWNIRDFLKFNPLYTRSTVDDVRVSIVDYFYSDVLSHPDLEQNKGNINSDSGSGFIGPISDSGDLYGYHGWAVGGVIAANFDDHFATGIHPYPEELNLEGIRFHPNCVTQLNDTSNNLPVCKSLKDTWHNYILKITNRLPFGHERTNQNRLKKGEKFVLNTSLAYGDAICLTTPGCRVIPDIYKAENAIKWRYSVANQQASFIHLAAAGNDNNNNLIPGFKASSASPWNMAATYDNPCTVLSGAEKAHCQKYYQSMITEKAIPALTNVVIVGAKKANVDALTDYSNIPELLNDSIYIAAPSEWMQYLCLKSHENKPCPESNVRIGGGGTSYATPQVSGVAALMWSIKPELSVDEVKSIILNSPQPPEPGQPAPKVKLLDAYNSILAIDEADTYPMLVRGSLLDVVDPVVYMYMDSSPLDIEDFKMFVEHFAQRESSGSTNMQDFSRYDLNGDGYTGGKRTTAFNLNVDKTEAGKAKYDEDLRLFYDYNSGYGYLNFKDKQVYLPYLTFNERKVTDMDILCYSALEYGLFDYQFDTLTKIEILLGEINKKHNTHLTCIPDGIYELTTTFGSSYPKTEFTGTWTTTRIDESWYQPASTQTESGTYNESSDLLLWHDCSIQDIPSPLNKVCRIDGKFVNTSKTFEFNIDDRYSPSTGTCTASIKFDNNVIEFNQFVNSITHFVGNNSEPVRTTDGTTIWHKKLTINNEALTFSSSENYSSSFTSTFWEKYTDVNFLPHYTWNKSTSTEDSKRNGTLKDAFRFEYKGPDKCQISDP